MIGTFFVNDKNDVAFALLNDQRKVEQILYSSDMRMATVHLDDGSEEFLTSDFEDPIHRAIIANNTLYVGNVNAQMEMTSEYEAKIVHV